MRYMTRPLHFFGPPGLLGMFSGAAILVVLLVQKIFWTSQSSFSTDLFSFWG